VDTHASARSSLAGLSRRDPSRYLKPLSDLFAGTFRCHLILVEARYLYGPRCRGNRPTRPAQVLDLPLRCVHQTRCLVRVGRNFDIGAEAGAGYAGGFRPAVQFGWRVHSPLQSKSTMRGGIDRHVPTYWPHQRKPTYTVRSQLTANGRTSEIAFPRSGGSRFPAPEPKRPCHDDK
jgi:hypothetical protein